MSRLYPTRWSFELISYLQYCANGFTEFLKKKKKEKKTPNILLRLELGKSSLFKHIQIFPNLCLCISKKRKNRTLTLFSS